MSAQKIKPEKSKSEDNLEKLGSEDVLKNPDLETAQLKFLLSLPEYTKDQAKNSQLLNIIVTNDMAPYYEKVCEELQWKNDDKLLKEMRERNEKALEAFDEEIEYAVNNLSVVDTKEAFLNKANYLSQIGDKDSTIETLSQAFGKTVALGYKLDNIFHCIRIGLFFMDLDLIHENLQRAETLIEQGADWHSRNCYKMCKAVYSLAVRDFAVATDLLVSAISTFICTELISLDDFVKYTVLSAVLTLNRSQVKKSLIDNPDIQQGLHFNKPLREFLTSLYDCDYKTFFLRLADVETLMRQDMLLYCHYKFYVREMKIKAYDQLLSTFISVGLAYMADQFGVTPEFIENEVSNFIAGGRLNYRIDKVNETVVNVPKNTKDEVLKSVVKQGDLLLNRVHKLSRVINI